MKFCSLVVLASSLLLAGCVDSGEHHVVNDPGGGATGAVSDAGTNASGAMNGYGAANGDPVTSTGNLGSGSNTSDPMNGANQIGPAVPF